MSQKKEQEVYILEMEADIRVFGLAIYQMVLEYFIIMMVK